MDDYIKREDALKELLGCVPTDVHEIEDLDVIRVMLALPSADVAPVRRAMWVEYGENKDGTHNMRCSKCGAGLKSKGHANSYYTKHKYRYCQNCGAKMDEEVDA